MKILSLPKKVILYVTNLTFFSILLFFTILLTFKIEKAITIQNFNHGIQSYYLISENDYQKVKKFNQIKLNSNGMNEMYTIQNIKYNQDFQNYQIIFVNQKKLKNHKSKNNQIVGIYDKVSIYSYLVDYIKQLKTQKNKNF